MSLNIPRRTYADLYGPTVGDRVRLADTELIIEVERDYTTYGDEITFGGGKVIRDGMGQSSRATREGEHGALDLVINKIDLAPHVGASLEVMERDFLRMRPGRPFIFTNLKSEAGAREIKRWLEDQLKTPPEERRSIVDAHVPQPHHHHSHTHDYSHEKQRGTRNDER